MARAQATALARILPSTSDARAYQNA